MSEYDTPSEQELLGECIQTIKDLQDRFQGLIDRFNSQQAQLDRLSMALARLQVPIPWTELALPEKTARKKTRSKKAPSSRSKGGRRPRGSTRVA
jgi:hypothetical protein